MVISLQLLGNIWYIDNLTIVLIQHSMFYNTNYLHCSVQSFVKSYNLLFSHVTVRCLANGIESFTALKYQLNNSWNSQ